MQFSSKLKELRANAGLTQEEVANRLYVSSQTVSKWERGLLTPDIKLLPRIAVLYHTSIDSIFSMESVWDEEHEKKLREKISLFHATGKYELAYDTMLDEIELRPDKFQDYCNIMLYVLQQKMFDEAHIRRMLQLAEYANEYCKCDDIRNEICRLMLQICSFSGSAKIRKKAVGYYKKLPQLKHSREVYARFVMEPAEYSAQLRKNIAYTVDLAECAIRGLITGDMTDEEKLFYFKKAAALFETINDDRYAGFYDIPLICDYCEIAQLLLSLGDHDEADKYVEKIIFIIQRQIAPEETVSPLIDDPIPEGHTHPLTNCKMLLKNMLSSPAFAEYREKLQCIAAEIDSK